MAWLRRAGWSGVDWFDTTFADSAEAFIAASQNADGGFGHAIAKRLAGSSAA